VPDPGSGGKRVQNGLQGELKAHGLPDILVENGKGREGPSGGDRMLFSGRISQRTKKARYTKTRQKGGEDSAPQTREKRGKRGVGSQEASSY